MLSKRFGVHVSPVRQIIYKHDAFRMKVLQTTIGQSRKRTARERRYLVQQAQVNTAITSAVLHRFLVNVGINVRNSTERSILKDATLHGRMNRQITANE